MSWAATRSAMAFAPVETKYPPRLRALAGAISSMLSRSMEFKSSASKTSLARNVTGANQTIVSPYMGITVSLRCEYRHVVELLYVPYAMVTVETPGGDSVQRMQPIERWTPSRPDLSA